MDKKIVNQFLDKIESIYKAEFPDEDDSCDMFILTFKDGVRFDTTELSSRKFAVLTIER